MSERTCQVDDFARLTEETERLAKHVEDLRHRIATANAKRRPSSGTLPAQHGGANSTPGPLSERPHHGPPSERLHHGPLSERPHHGPPSERLHHGPRTERPSGCWERPQPSAAPISERPSCLASVSRWLPPLSPPRSVMDSGVRESESEPGRYRIVSPPRERALVRPKPPKTDVV